MLVNKVRCKYKQFNASTVRPWSIICAVDKLWLLSRKRHRVPMNGLEYRPMECLYCLIVPFE